MPIFEYRCRSCDHPFEALVFGSETPTCPACGGEKLEKRFSTFGVGASRPTSGDAPACAPGGG